MKKLPLIGILVLLLQSCSFFTKTPKGVIEGQRAVYQSVLSSHASVEKIIDTYVTDCKKLIMYHTNYVFQLKLKEIEGWEENDWRDKEEHKHRAEVKKDDEIKRAFESLDLRADFMRSEAKKHHDISLKLIGAIYDYLSTSPIEVDNLDYWVNKLAKIEEEK